MTRVMVSPGSDPDVQFCISEAAFLWTARSSCRVHKLGTVYSVIMSSCHIFCIATLLVAGEIVGFVIDDGDADSKAGTVSLFSNNDQVSNFYAY